MGKKIAVTVTDLFEDVELTSPAESFEAAGHEVAPIEWKAGKGIDITGYRSIRNDLKNAGANYKDEEVVVSRNIVTSRTPDDLPAFNRESLNLLGR
ncbi:DJ-1/PfpI family protein [Paenibacillus durus]|uniref:DJ-1/PfpI domain-containing protein n=1 Tax=Paenibacillus durus ATCC 35681 TaxID=1333534 RepID=A0A0F7FCE1_PAEDU|nr:DJ-1/PfpI family protein [Paenibacillus durus]AKG36053.1 hypothetical protein VK70_17030 [Paenibacillus durus ATCC 35681]